MNIAIYSPNWIGDAVMALPFVNACREQFPGDTLTVIAKQWVAPVYEQHPALDYLISLPAERLSGLLPTTVTGWGLRGLKFDKIYLLTNSLRSAYIARLAHIGERVGYTGQVRGWLLNQSVPLPGAVEHRSLGYLRLLKGGQELSSAQGPGITFSDAEKNWALKQLESLGSEQPLAVLPGSKAPARRVPLEKWRAFLSPFAEAGQGLLLIGGASDAAIANSIVASLPEGAATSTTGQYSLRQSLALLSQCAGAIATDSGLGHAAANLGLPTLSIFGSENPDLTRPLGQRATVIKQDVHCSPCRKNQCHNNDEPLLCLNSIEPGAVWEAYAQL